MNDDDRESAESAQQKSIRGMMQSGVFGAAELGATAARPVTRQSSIRHLLRNQPTESMSRPVPAAKLLGNPEIRKTNAHLAELLDLAKTEAADQRARADAERRRADGSLLAARIASAVAILSLVAQIVFFALTR